MNNFILNQPLWFKQFLEQDIISERRICSIPPKQLTYTWRHEVYGLSKHLDSFVCFGDPVYEDSQH